MRKLKIFIIALGIFWFSEAHAANPTINADTQTVIRDITETSFTFSHTVSAGSNQMLFVYVVDNSGTNVSTVTYGGTGMTVVTDSSGTGTVTYAYMADPPVGTANIEVTCGGSHNHAMAVSMTVNDVLGIGDTDLKTPSGAQTSMTQWVTSTAQNSLILQGLYVNGDGADVADGSLQTLVVELDNNNSQHWHVDYRNATTTEPYKLTQTWTGAGVAAASWAVELTYDAPAGAVVTTRRRIFRHY